MSSPHDLTAAGPRELLQIATAASQHYLDGRSKIEIAEQMGLSRFKVARLLTAARELGIIRFEISVPDAIHPQLSTRLGEAYGLRQAIVVDSPDDPVSALNADLGRVTANLLAELVHEGDVVGVSWGRTINSMATALTSLERCSIVQMAGAMPGAAVDDNAVELVRRMAQISGGPAYPIYAPLVLADAGVAASLRGHAEVAAAMSLYNRIDVAIVPIGSWHPPRSQLYDSLGQAERKVLLGAGVAADTSTVLIGTDGAIIATPLTDRMIAITGPQLVKVPEVVAVAGGTTKAEAVQAVLRAGFVTTLITNASVARFLLARGGDPPGASSPAAPA